MNFEQYVNDNKGVAIIFAGSDSDKPHIDKLADSLKKYGIPFRVRICSAHKQPDTLFEIIHKYNTIDSSIAFIAVAGKTDALSGILSFHALHPVISCAPDPINMSCVQNPPGSANAYIAHASNVGKFIAQMYAHINNEYKNKILEYNKSKIEALEEKDEQLYEQYKKGEQ